MTEESLKKFLMEMREKTSLRSFISISIYDGNWWGV
jgi:hypothetical protein